VGGPLEVDGPGAPPRSNGELVFAAPWESRAFGVVMTLYEDGILTWPVFQAALIARIAAWEADPEQCGWSYYEHWLGALEDGLGGAVADEVTARALLLADRPAGHDHRDGEAGHGHGH
jgi:nitrile hydratase accessory protein